MELYGTLGILRFALLDNLSSLYIRFLPFLSTTELPFLPVEIVMTYLLEIRIW